MPAPSPLATFIEPLERLGLPYCITGSVASSVYGEPRLTIDIDVVLLLAAKDVDMLRTAFPDHEYYVPPEETIRQQLAPAAHGMFNLLHHATQFKADIYIAGDDVLHAWALQERRRIDLEGSGAWIAPPEYVIVRKLEYLREGGSDKHVRDIRFIVAATTLDRAFLDAQVTERGLEEQWRGCLGNVQ